MKLLEPSPGVVRIVLPDEWFLTPPIIAIVDERLEAYAPTYDFRLDRIWLVIPHLYAAGFEDEARALANWARRKGVRNTTEIVKLRANALADLQHATEPKEVKHPIALAALHDLEEAARIGLPAKMQLKPYQRVGCAFLRLTGFRALIGDEMGLGKSASAIVPVLCAMPRLLPAVVVGPPGIFVNWQLEIKKWLPSIEIYPMGKRNSEPPPPGFKGIIVTTYALIPHQIDALLEAEPRYFIIDEAHRIKNPDTLQSQACAELCEEIPHVVMLTGTPIENNTGELKNLLDMLDGGKEIVGDLDLKTRLGRLMIRRLKADVAKDLPELTRQYVPVDPPEELIEEYRKAEKEFQTWIEEELTKRMEVALAAAGHDIDDIDVRSEMFREVKARVERATQAEALTRVGYLRQLVGKMKIPAAIEFACEYFETGRPLIMFGVHQEVVHGIATGIKKANKKIRVGVFEGSTPKAKRGQLVSDFQDGKIDVIIGSEAMREGVTLARANTVYVTEHMWTTAREEQAEGRAHRIGQVNAVLAVYPEVEGTLDDRMHAILEHKRRLVKSVVGAPDIKAARGAMSALIMSYAGKEIAKVEEAGAVADPKKPKKKRRSITRSDVMAIVFDPSLWTLAQAKTWLKANGFRRVETDTIQGRIVAKPVRLLGGLSTRKPRGKTFVITQGVTLVV